MLAWYIILSIILFIAFMMKSNKGILRIILFDISIMGMSLLQIYKDTNSLLFSIMVTLIGNILIYVITRLAYKANKNNDSIKE